MWVHSSRTPVFCSRRSARRHCFNKAFHQRAQRPHPCWWLHKGTVRSTMVMAFSPHQDHCLLKILIRTPPGIADRSNEASYKASLRVYEADAHYESSYPTQLFKLHRLTVLRIGKHLRRARVDVIMTTLQAKGIFGAVVCSHIRKPFSPCSLPARWSRKFFADFPSHTGGSI